MEGKHWLDDSLLEFRRLKRAAEKALAQVGDDDFFRVLDPESNSLAILVKHLAGNLRSRWMDFLTSDGEKPDRNRDSEFVIEPADTRAALMERWERGWKHLFEALEPLGEDDLGRTVPIRGEPHTIVQAVNRSSPTTPATSARSSFSRSTSPAPTGKPSASPAASPRSSTRR